MPTLIYATATQHINSHPYTVTLPPHALLRPQELTPGDNFVPIFEPFDDLMYQRAMITISKMVELVIARTTFILVVDLEVLEVLHQIDAYVEEVYPMKERKDVGDYINDILKLRVHIYKTFRRVLARHPKWMDVYMEKDSLFDKMSSLYRSIGVDLKRPMTLIDDLAICPTTRRDAERDKLREQTELLRPGGVRKSMFDV